MKKLFVLFLLFTSLVFAAPIQGVAVNQDGKCAGYWSGNDNEYPLPDGWRVYYPNSEKQITINETTCDFSNGPKDCCEQLNKEFTVWNIGNPNSAIEEAGSVDIAEMFPVYLAVIVVVSGLYYLIEKIK